MDSASKKYIKEQAEDRQAILSAIHTIILEEDKTITPVIEPMMGKEMIIYKDRGSMKYGLSSVKNHISLHVLPIYGSPTLYGKYQKLLDKAKFQKGCINFTSSDQMPIAIVRQLFAECSSIDLVKIREEYLQSKKNKPKK